jgi:oligopeptide/dipeptide ABC transporter ATP-binding protein
VSAPANALLSIRDLVVRYEPGRRRGDALTAVSGVSLDIAAGSIFALVGESGAGKTSLAQAILQLVPASGGQIGFRGRDLNAIGPNDLGDARRAIQYVFQNSLAALSPRRTVMQSVREPLDHFRVGRAAEREQRARQTLISVGLDPELGSRYPGALSGGQRQRVALARALAPKPDLIIADEPLSSLDVSVRSRVMDLILRLREETGVTFLLITHDLAVARRLADTVAVMYCGQILESGPAGRVLRNPAHPYTQAMLAAIPLPDPDAEAPRVLDGEPPSPLTPPAGCVFHSRCRERLEHCSRQVPPEVRLETSTEPAGGGIGSEHRVCCHLRSSPLHEISNL